jgi:hypothetical protein
MSSMTSPQRWTRWTPSKTVAADPVRPNVRASIDHLQLELRHRQHAPVEDRIRQAKAAGLRNLPCHRADANMAWLEIILAATDLVAWSKLIGFIEHPDLATCEIDTFRHRVLHVAARITRGARQTRLRIDATAFDAIAGRSSRAFPHAHGQQVFAIVAATFSNPGANPVQHFVVES